MTQSVKLAPRDAEAHCNLGNTFKDLGRVDEAEASYTQAIELKPDFAEAHNNLGITLKDLGRFDEAETRYRQAIALKLTLLKPATTSGLSYLREENTIWPKSNSIYPRLVEVKFMQFNAHFAG